MMPPAPAPAPAPSRAPLVVGALALLLAACRGAATQPPEDLPRGIAPGDEAPMTNREANREPADRDVEVGPPTPNVRHEGGINVPGDSSAAARNWQPREEEGEGDEGETGDEGDEGEGEAGDEGDEDGEVVDSEPVEPDEDEIGGGGPADRS